MARPADRPCEKGGEHRSAGAAKEGVSEQDGRRSAAPGRSEHQAPANDHRRSDPGQQQAQERRIIMSAKPIASRRGCEWDDFGNEISLIVVRAPCKAVADALAKRYKGKVEAVDPY